ncbi:MAG: hypothetical protein QNJ49_08650 [Mastigocoleus sp. MO_167.B18]|uniref:hypothetical protein n=1 Tax=Mastigocoleus sp. MO_188.B34 TaxID=3036635 RepID=UPI002620AC84|nr:hypothetical protein [Mastigocoleus sp. MO_188.B34]MDJ0695644.1 hypothetical protein [Mastigocoleus sp. MO_188.B34]MDJ0773484.1 hypothetical protein [Mastigocoleus sp. MO_167.B18]
MTTLLDKLRSLREKVPEEDRPIINWGVEVIKEKLAHNKNILTQGHKKITSRLSSIKWTAEDPLKSLEQELEFLRDEILILHKIARDCLEIIDTKYVPNIKQNFKKFFPDDETSIKTQATYFDEQAKWFLNQYNQYKKAKNTNKIEDSIYYKVGYEVCKAISDTLKKP